MKWMIRAITPITSSRCTNPPAIWNITNDTSQTPKNKKARIRNKKRTKTHFLSISLNKLSGISNMELHNSYKANVDYLLASK